MNEQQKDQYIYLLENFKNAAIHSGRGWKMNEIEILKRIEEFEASLECNKAEFCEADGCNLPKHCFHYCREHHAILCVD